MTAAPSQAAARPVGSAVALSATGITKLYPAKDGRTTGISGISLDIAEKTVVAVVGRSGSGKSTLLRTMAGLVTPDSGEVLCQGAPVTGPPPQLRCVFQDYGESLFPWTTVLGNVEFGARHGPAATRADRRRRAREALRLVGLPDVDDRYPWELSGGMQQRASIARALASQPRILLLDEPFGAVDALSRARLQDMLQEVSARLELTTVFVTHDLDEAVYLADRVVVVDQRGEGLTADLPITLPRPRHPVDSRESETFLSVRRALLETVLQP
ncbi:ABC transporter ATP-binding protein [Streptomyces tremellae]|uniref:ABC transporter ATP-binding protein n=1 Tax=Streptomyces tremellae TaxID=1124239 RepID=A0ABP7FHH7_9ACTN